MSRSEALLKESAQFTTTDGYQFEVIHCVELVYITLSSGTFAHNVQYGPTVLLRGSYST